MVAGVDQDFWPVVAQTVPVLTLALVIEARAFARRVARDDGESIGRVFRVYFAISTLAVAIALTVAFAVAMTILARGQSNEIWVSIALYTLAPAISLVVLNPLIPLFDSVLGEVRHAVYDHRLEKRRQAQLLDLDKMINEGETAYREKSAASMANFSGNFVAALRITRVHRGSSDLREMRLVSKMHAYLTDQERAFRELQDYRADFRSHLQTARDFRAEVDSDRYQVDKSYYLKPLRDMID